MKSILSKSLVLHLVFFISFVVITSNNLVAQNKYDLEQFFREGGKLTEQPLKWNLGDWLKLGGIAAGTYAIMQFDNEIKTDLLDIKSNNSSIPMTFARIYGEPYSSLGIGFYFLIQGANKGNVKNKKFGFEILESFVYTGIITSIAKIAFGRKRPYATDNAFEFSPFSSIFEDENLSFFSGHTSVAFSLSTIIAGNVEGTGWEIVSFLPAILTGYSRIYHNKHWTSDVIMGAAVGYLVGRFVINTHEGNENYMDGNIVSPQPLVSFLIPLN